MLHFWFADTVIVPIIQIAIFCTWPAKLCTIIFMSSLSMTRQTNIRVHPVQVIIIHHWVFWALKIICIYSYKVFVKEHIIYYIICSFTKTLIPQLHVYIPVHSFTKAWTCIPQFHTLYLLQLQLHKCLWLVSFNFSICIIFYMQMYVFFY